MIARYLARRDPIDRPVDRVVLMGSAVLESVDAAATAHRVYGVPILVTGGIGHSTSFLEEALRRRDVESATGRPESHVFGDLLISAGVAPEDIAVEDRSTNCGENAAFTRDLISTPQTLLLIQDPTMQRRTHACFERSFADLPGTTLISRATTSTSPPKYLPPTTVSLPRTPRPAVIRRSHLGIVLRADDQPAFRQDTGSRSRRRGRLWNPSDTPSGAGFTRLICCGFSRRCR
ncbi:YdcF family protein [Kribbella sp. C-35]|uniref:YdcF family protein n=1 Tax=Kribbella sp. C-35 TaxID=2789276 RepID=UPI00397DB27D